MTPSAPPRAVWPLTAGQRRCAGQWSPGGPTDRMDQGSDSCEAVAWTNVSTFLSNFEAFESPIFEWYRESDLTRFALQPATTVLLSYCPSHGTSLVHGWRRVAEKHSISTLVSSTGTAMQITISIITYFNYSLLSAAKSDHDWTNNNNNDNNTYCIDGTQHISLGVANRVF